MPGIILYCYGNSLTDALLTYAPWQSQVCGLWRIFHNALSGLPESEIFCKDTRNIAKGIVCLGKIYPSVFLFAATQSLAAYQDVQSLFIVF